MGHLNPDPRQGINHLIQSAFNVNSLLPSSSSSYPHSLFATNPLTFFIMPNRRGGAGPPAPSNSSSSRRLLPNTHRNFNCVLSGGGPPRQRLVPWSTGTPFAGSDVRPREPSAWRGLCSTVGPGVVAVA